MTVFDFDKTLTDRDTLAGFYREVAGDHSGYALKRLVMLAAAVLYKLRLIDNTRLKKIGVRLFLVGKTRAAVTAAAERYARRIRLNGLYESAFLATDPAGRLILSASLEVYLSARFPGERIVGSRLRYRNERVAGLEINRYGTAKRDYLHRRGIDRIAALYTDSSDDRPLMDLADRTYLVAAGRVVRQIDRSPISATAHSAV